MFGVSLFEVLIVAVVMFCCCDKEDIIFFLKYLRRFFAYLQKTKRSIILYCDELLSEGGKTTVKGDDNKEYEAYDVSKLYEHNESNKKND